MPISVRWENNEKTIVRWEFDGRWTWNDYYDALEQSDRLLDSIQRSADLLVNMQQTNFIANGYPAQFRRVSRFHPKAGIAVLVITNAFIETMLRMMMRFQPQSAHRIIIARSLEKAQSILQEHQQRSV